MAAKEGSVLRLINLTKVFRDFWGRERVKALDGLNLQVHRGEVFGLLGPNGSGKTTTVRIVLGLLFPTSGAVRLFNRPPTSVDVKKRVGYMPEESHLYSYLNAEETLDFFGRLFGLSAADRRRRTDALIDMVGLKRARKRPLGEYSKGMARRIGLAQSLINDPDLLILDEPTTGLDPVGSREMKDLILTLKERGKTIFLCSHLLADVEEICDRICILYGGKQRAMGPVGDLLTAGERTQIKAPHLDEATLARVLAIIREVAGTETDIEVSAPTRRLEELFLQVIEEARRERLTTAGAEMGAGTADFLGQGERDGEELVGQLVAAAREAEQYAEAPEAEELASMPRSGDSAVIEQLMEGEPEPEETAEEVEEPETPARPAGPVRRELLDELMEEPEAEPEKDDQDAQ